MLVDIGDVFVFNTTLSLGNSGIDSADGSGSKGCNCNVLHDVGLIVVMVDIADKGLKILEAVIEYLFEFCSFLQDTSF